MITIHQYELNNKQQNTRELLRKNIAHYLKQDSSTVKIKINKNGKPYVKGLFFSISHSKNLLLQAFSKTNEMGLDVEYINPKRNVLKLAKRYFHPQEVQYLNSLPNKKAINTFYQLWTCKEAVCKAEGGRLWFYLSDNYLLNNKITDRMKDFQLTKITKFDNFACALATKFKVDKVKYENV